MLLFETLPMMANNCLARTFGSKGEAIVKRCVRPLRRLHRPMSARATRSPPGELDGVPSSSRVMMAMGRWQPRRCATSRRCALIHMFPIPAANLSSHSRHAHGGIGHHIPGTKRVFCDTGS